VTSGKIPVIAHIERYECLEKNIKLIEKLIEHGVKIQVNAESVLKPKLFGDKHKKYKQRAKYFLEKDIVDIISSDAHNLDTRKPYMKEAYDVILKKYGFSEDEVMTFGDQWNDFDMLKLVKYGYLMGNASEDLKKEFTEDRITLSNDDEGIYHIIKDIL